MLDSMSAPSSPFPTTNQEFLEGVFGVHWPRVHVCAIPGDPRDPALPKFYWRGGPAHPEIAACTLDTNNYYCVGLFRNNSRQLINFEALVVLGIDDIGPKVDRDRVLDLLGVPTYRIETSPGNEQWGYVLDPPITYGDGAAAFQHKIRVELTGAEVRDPGMEGLNRYLRLPYGMNGKADYGPGGHRTRFMAWGD